MLTKKERQLLIAARALIKSGDFGRICWALQFGATHEVDDPSDPEWYIACARLRFYITQRLGIGVPSLEYWQQERGIYHTPEQCRKDRLDWIDWMLGEL